MIRLQIVCVEGENGHADIHHEGHCGRQSARDDAWREPDDDAAGQKNEARPYKEWAAACQEDG